MAAVAPAGSAPVIQDGWLQSCCCVTQKPRDEIAQWMLLDTNAHASPSCMQMLLCQCRSEERVASGIEDVPQLAGLAGATLQRAPPDWPTKGSVQTLKWCTYDKEKRVADLQVFGGFGGPSNVGLWTEPVSLKWHCLINLARCCVRACALERSLALRTRAAQPCHIHSIHGHRIFSRSPAAQNYSYRFTFSEDYRHADIQIRANCCCVCLVPPCAPAWCKVPDAITRFNAVQHESSGSGEYWVRSSSTCAGDCTAPATEPETFAMRHPPLSTAPLLSDIGARGPALSCGQGSTRMTS